MYKYVVWAGLLLSGLFFSCTVSPEDIRVDELSGVEMGGATLSQARLTVKMTLANDSPVRLAVKNGTLTVKDDKGQIAEIRMDESLVLRRKSSTEIALPLVVRFNGAFGSATALSRLAADPGKLLINGYIQAKSGLFGRKIQIENMPLDEFLRIIGISGPESLNL